MSLPTTPEVIDNVSSTAVNQTTEILVPFDDVTVYAIASVLIFLLVFGFVGNLLTILVIVTSSKLNNVFNQFILSLCVSDLLSCMISWTNLYRRTWGFLVFEPPNFFCWFYWAADMWTSYVTAQHILSFAILRLISVWKPLSFTKINLLHGRIWVSIIWCVGFLCGFIPFALFSGAKVRDRTDRTNPTARWPACTQNLETLEAYSNYIQYAYPIFFYIPLVAVAIVSAAIGIILVKKRSQMSRSRTSSDIKKEIKEKQKERQAILQLTLIVGSFILGYVPFTAFEFFTLYSTDTSYEGWKKEWMFGTLQYVCLRLSECLNPIFYNLASTKMRRETKKFLKRFDCRKSTDFRDRSESAVSTGQSGLEL